MTLFIKDLDENGRPQKVSPAECQQCGFTALTWHGLRVHMAIHRIGPGSYHTKDGLLKSGRHT